MQHSNMKAIDFMSSPEKPPSLYDSPLCVLLQVLDLLQDLRYVLFVVKNVVSLPVVLSHR